MSTESPSLLILLFVPDWQPSWLLVSTPTCLRRLATFLASCFNTNMSTEGPSLLILFFVPDWQPSWLLVSTPICLRRLATSLASSCFNTDMSTEGSSLLILFFVPDWQPSWLLLVSTLTDMSTEGPSLLILFFIGSLPGFFLFEHQHVHKRSLSPNVLLHFKLSSDTQRWGRINLEEMHTYFRGERLENYLGTTTLNTPIRDFNPYLPVIASTVYTENEALGLGPFSQEVKEGFGNQINLCRDRGLNPGPPAQESDTLPLDHQVIDQKLLNA
uniref:Uncharacterized protein n=1 Tax=Timema shepardi TaxID=629360 RepID=A0A7R9B697_TIMSH|nr:unnamed protein product [Timema shepardi]